MDLGAQGGCVCVFLPDGSMRLFDGAPVAAREVLETYPEFEVVPHTGREDPASGPRKCLPPDQLLWPDLTYSLVRRQTFLYRGLPALHKGPHPPTPTAHMPQQPAPVPATPVPAASPSPPPKERWRATSSPVRPVTSGPSSRSSTPSTTSISSSSTWFSNHSTASTCSSSRKACGTLATVSEPLLSPSPLSLDPPRAAEKGFFKYRPLNSGTGASCQNPRPGCPTTQSLKFDLNPAGTRSSTLDYQAGTLREQALSSVPARRRSLADIGSARRDAQCAKIQSLYQGGDVSSPAGPWAWPSSRDDVMNPAEECIWTGARAAASPCPRLSPRTPPRRRSLADSLVGEREAQAAVMEARRALEHAMGAAEVGEGLPRLRVAGPAVPSRRRSLAGISDAAEDVFSAVREVERTGPHAHPQAAAGCDVESFRVKTPPPQAFRSIFPALPAGTSPSHSRVSSFSSSGDTTDPEAGTWGAPLGRPAAHHSLPLKAMTSAYPCQCKAAPRRCESNPAGEAPPECGCAALDLQRPRRGGGSLSHPLSPVRTSSSQCGEQPPPRAAWTDLAPAAARTGIPPRPAPLQNLHVRSFQTTAHAPLRQTVSDLPQRACGTPGPRSASSGAVFSSNRISAVLSDGPGDRPRHAFGKPDFLDPSDPCQVASPRRGRLSDALGAGRPEGLFVLSTAKCGTVAQGRSSFTACRPSAPDPSEGDWLDYLNAASGSRGALNAATGGMMMGQELGCGGLPKDTERVKSKGIKGTFQQISRLARRKSLEVFGERRGALK